MTTGTTTKRASKSRFRSTKLATVLTAFGTFALVLGGVGLVGAQTEDSPQPLVVRRPVIVVDSNGQPVASDGELRQAPSAPPRSSAIMRQSRQSRGS